MNKLTAKQEAFCQNIALEKKTQYESYCLAYPKQAKNSIRKTLNTHANSLMQNEEIMRRILSLKTEIDNKIQKELVYTAVDSFNKLNSLQDKAETDNNINSAIKAEELKGKLASLYVEQKKELSPSEFKDWLKDRK